jgi:hypothetical protein
VPFDEVIEANSGTPSEQAQLAVWGVLLGFGNASKGLRQLLEALDLFVGRYLLLTTIAYCGIKFVHFKVFDPFPM